MSNNTLYSFWLTFGYAHYEGDKQVWSELKTRVTLPKDIANEIIMNGDMALTYFPYNTFFGKHLMHVWLMGIEYQSEEQ